MNQLTIRGFEPELSEFIRSIAKKEQISMNQAVINLLQKATGIGKKKSSNCIGNSLDSFIGSWSDNEKKSFDSTISYFDKIDDDMWK
ncbi:MAG: hypothetical protein KZQ83_12045 [gamma proteobacterium symbiont of Taylorina sp.]|nr:hypothetical protein [gamma proteobacterium symbiont of Taylorina sp.]